MFRRTRETRIIIDLNQDEAHTPILEKNWDDQINRMVVPFANDTRAAIKERPKHVSLDGAMNGSKMRTKDRSCRKVGLGITRTLVFFESAVEFVPVYEFTKEPFDRYWN